MKTELCRSCMRPIHHDGEHWIHSDYNPRHPAIPRIENEAEPEAARHALKVLALWRMFNRRDRCGFVGSHTQGLEAHHAAAAWNELGRQLERISEHDVPKFNELLEAIRTATIRSRAPCCADCRHWQPVAEFFGMRGWGACKGFDGGPVKGDSFTDQLYRCRGFAQADAEERIRQAGVDYSEALEAARAAQNAPGAFGPCQATALAQNAAPAPSSAQGPPQRIPDETP